MKEIIYTEKTISHPFEDALGIEPNTTVVQVPTTVGELVDSPVYDDKDVEIEQDYQKVIDTALEVVTGLQDAIDSAEPRHHARMTEVTSQMLNVAISAINGKAKIKERKDKNVASTNQPPKTVNNILTIDRNELLRKLKGDSSE
jgi:hypothetical protein